jgi:hypothetical protein
VSNGEIYVASQDGNLYAFGLTTSSQRPAQRPNLKQLHPNLDLRASNGGSTN